MLTEQKRKLLHLRGRYRFANGEQDLDESWLKPTPQGQLPALVKYRHVFFRADGSLERLSETDLNSGQATCSVYKDGVVQRQTRRLAFPADSYAGPALVLPIRAFLRHRASTRRELHSFNCSPGPEIYTIQISTITVPHWSYHTGAVVEASVRPHLERFDVLISPFLPNVRLWFDPLRVCEFIGAESVRYYRGPGFLMVSERNPYG
jgi:hypothetical protein